MLPGPGFSGTRLNALPILPQGTTKIIYSTLARWGFPNTTDAGGSCSGGLVKPLKIAPIPPAKLKQWVQRSKYHHCHGMVGLWKPERSNRVSGWPRSNCLLHLHRCLNADNVRLELSSFPKHCGRWQGSALRAMPAGVGKGEENQAQQLSHHTFFSGITGLLGRRAGVEMHEITY